MSGKPMNTKVNRRLTHSKMYPADTIFADPQPGQTESYIRVLTWEICCGFCNNFFEATRRDAVFCSDSCRQANHQWKT